MTLQHGVRPFKSLPNFRKINGEIAHHIRMLRTLTWKKKSHLSLDTQGILTKENLLGVWTITGLSDSFQRYIELFAQVLQRFRHNGKTQPLQLILCVFPACAGQVTKNGVGTNHKSVFQRPDFF